MSQYKHELQNRLNEVQIEIAALEKSIELNDLCYGDYRAATFKLEDLRFEEEELQELLG